MGRQTTRLEGKSGRKHTHLVHEGNCLQIWSSKSREGLHAEVVGVHANAVAPTIGPETNKRNHPSNLRLLHNVVATPPVATQIANVCSLAILPEHTRRTIKGREDVPAAYVEAF